jgi:hypothetical protein
LGAAPSCFTASRLSYPRHNRVSSPSTNRGSRVTARHHTATRTLSARAIGRSIAHLAVSVSFALQELASSAERATECIAGTRSRRTSGWAAEWHVDRAHVWFSMCALRKAQLAFSRPARTSARQRKRCIPSHARHCRRARTHVRRAWHGPFIAWSPVRPRLQSCCVALLNLSHLSHAARDQRARATFTRLSCMMRDSLNGLCPATRCRVGAVLLSQQATTALRNLVKLDHAQFRLGVGNHTARRRSDLVSAWVGTSGWWPATCVRGAGVS